MALLFDKRVSPRTTLHRLGLVAEHSRSALEVETSPRLIARLERGEYKSVGEAEYQALAEYWLAQSQTLFFHDYDSRRNDPGLPDLVILKAHDVLWIELKSHRGRARPAQVQWGDKLGGYQAGHRYFCLWPRDWQLLRDLCLEP